MTSVPLSVSQEALWISWELDPDQARYLIPYPLRVTGTLDVARLRLAVAEIGARYPVLRARVAESDKGTGAELTWAQAPPIPVAERTVDGDLDAAVRKASYRPFDLRSGPLARIEILRGPAETIVLMCIHHIVFDGGSLLTVLNQLRRAYGGESLSGPPETALLAEFARSQHELASGEAGAPLRDFWRRYLADARTQGRLPAGADAGQPCQLSQPIGLSSRIAERAAEAGTTRFGFFLAAFFLLMRRYLGEEELTIAIPFHGRARGELRSVVGFFSNTLPIRQHITATSSYADVIKSLHANVRGVLPFGELPMTTIVSEIMPRDAAGAPRRLPALFQYWNATRRDDVDVRAVELTGPEGTCTLDLLTIADQAEYDFTVMVRDDSAGTTLVWKDPSGVAGPALVESMASDYEALLTAMVDDPQGRVGEAGDRGRLRVAEIGPLPVGDLRAFARADRRDAADVLLAALVALLAWYTGSDELVVGGVKFAADPNLSFSDLLGRTGAVPRGSADASQDVTFRFAYGGGDLFLDVLQHDGELGARLRYDPSGLDDWQARAMAGHFSRLLGAALASPQTKVGEFEPLSDDERRQQLVAWNDTSAWYEATTLPALVLRQARRSPAATALVHGAACRSYDQLAERASQIARALVARGVRPGEPVALILPRGIDQVEAVVGILLAGGCYLSIDPGTPAERASFILTDAGVRRVIGAKPAGADVELIGVEDLGPGHDDVALPELTPAQPAYCIYTSGTTGRPKGVLVSHENVVRLVANDRFPLEVGPADVWTLFHPYGFDVSAWETFGCLTSGGTLVIVEDAQARDSQRFWRLLAEHRVTVLSQTPSAFRQLRLVAQAEPAPLDHLRYVIFGGEKLQPGTLRTWMAEYPQVRLVNMYGITETAIHSTVAIITASDAAADRSNIGVPLPATVVHVVDPRDGRRLLPVGAAGELLVGGAGLAGGYLGRPRLTAQRFVPDPFGAGTMFRSGDLARRHSDGTLEYLGRCDDQIKLRGYRIEPGEIEACLREQDDIADAVVRPGSADRLVAFVRPAAGTGPLSAARLRDALRARLPDYMIPARYAVVSGFPLTANGKLDVAALTALAEPVPEMAGPAPATATSQALARIWRRLLEVTDIHGDSSFFELGGDSLQVGKLVNEIERELGIRIPLRALFDHRQLDELAGVIDERLAKSGQGSGETRHA
jgi:amino acid adenylation domain-containing protein